MFPRRKNNENTTHLRTRRHKPAACRRNERARSGYPRLAVKQTVQDTAPLMDAWLPLSKRKDTRSPVRGPVRPWDIYPDGPLCQYLWRHHMPRPLIYQLCHVQEALLHMGRWSKSLHMERERGTEAARVRQRGCQKGIFQGRGHIHQWHRLYVLWQVQVSKEAP